MEDQPERVMLKAKPPVKPKPKGVIKDQEEIPFEIKLESEYNGVHKPPLESSQPGNSLEEGDDPSILPVHMLRKKFEDGLKVNPPSFAPVTQKPVSSQAQNFKAVVSIFEKNAQAITPTPPTVRPSMIFTFTKSWILVKRNKSFFFFRNVTKSSIFNDHKK